MAVPRLARTYGPRPLKVTAAHREHQALHSDDWKHEVAGLCADCGDFVDPDAEVEE